MTPKCSEYEAVRRYNAAYNNAQYSWISYLVSIALGTDRDYLMISNEAQAEHNQFMNMLIDACYERCGHPTYHGRIISICTWANALSGEIRHEVDEYLRRFNKEQTS